MVPELDGAYEYSIAGNPVTTFPERYWTWNGNLTQRPYPDEFNPNNDYYFFFIGDGTSEEFGFQDSGYGDNSGSLTFEIWKRIE